MRLTGSDQVAVEATARAADLSAERLKLRWVMTSTFRARLRFRLGKPLTSDESLMTATILGRSVSIKPHKRDQIFKDANWIVINAGGFASEAEAWQFGSHLKAIVEIAGAAARIGVDIGLDQPTCFIAEEFARGLNLIEPHEEVWPNVHGLTVHPDDDRYRYPLVEAEAKVTADPMQFVGALSELGVGAPFDIAPARDAVRAINLALLAREPLSQVVFAVSAIEALGQSEKWSKRQRELLQALAQQVEIDGDPDDIEAVEVAAAIRRGTHRIGLRQGVLRVFRRLGLGHLAKDWDRLYDVRSGIFHGTRTVPDSEAAELAQAAISLCGQVITALLSEHGIPVPTVAQLHFSAPSAE